MNFYSLSLLLACAAFAQAQATDQTQPVINTPMAVVQCLPTQVTFSGGIPPYYITAIPASQTNASPLANLGTQTGSSYTWKVAIAAGTAVTLQIRDSKGSINFSQAFTVQPGGDTSCMTSGNDGSTTSSSHSTPPSSPSSNPSGPTTGSNSSTNASVPGTSTSSSNSAATSAPNSAAHALTFQSKDLFLGLAIAGAISTVFA